MKKLIFFLIILLSFTAAHAQTTWEKKLQVYHEGKLAPGDVTSVLETPDKGFIVTGIGITNDGKRAGFIYKLNKDGDSVWCKTYELTFLARIANVFYNRSNQLMIAMEMLIPNKKHNIVFAKINENTGDTSNSFVAAKPNNADAYKYVSHVEMEDGSYIVLATDVSTTYEGASHLFRFMPGETTHIWNADSLAGRVWKFNEMWLDGDGLMLTGSANTGVYRQSYLVVRYGLDGKPRWTATYPVSGDYFTTRSFSVVPGPSNNYISVGEKMAIVGGVWQTTPATALIGTNGDTQKYTTLQNLLPGGIHKIIKTTSGYYGVGQILKPIKAPDSGDYNVYSFALFNISGDGNFTVASDYNAGMVPVAGGGGWMSTFSDGKGLIQASDGELVLYGTGTTILADKNTITSPYIIKTKAPSSTVSIKKPRENILLNIYPNPAYNRLYINALGESGNLRIVDLLGQEIYSTQVSANEDIFIDVKHFPAGTYMVQFMNENSISTTKFMKTN